MLSSEGFEEQEGMAVSEGGRDGTNVLMKVGSSVSPNDLAIGIDMCLGEQHSNWFRGIICNRQFAPAEQHIEWWTFEELLLSNEERDNEGL